MHVMGSRPPNPGEPNSGELSGSLNESWAVPDRLTWPDWLLTNQPINWGSHQMQNLMKLFKNCFHAHLDPFDSLSVGCFWDLTDQASWDHSIWGEGGMEMSWMETGREITAWLPAATEPARFPGGHPSCQVCLKEGRGGEEVCPSSAR